MELAEKLKGGDEKLGFPLQATIDIGWKGLPGHLVWSPTHYNPQNLI